MRKGRQPTILTTLVFTDIVSSTPMAEEMGDRRWRELLDRHYTIIRRELREHGGKELDTAGDGVFARFDSPAAAIRWACAVVDGVRELGVELRVGIPYRRSRAAPGEAERLQRPRRGGTMGEAGAGQILVTGSVGDLVRGSGSGSRTAVCASCAGSRASGTCSRWRASTEPPVLQPFLPRKAGRSSPRRSSSGGARWPISCPHRSSCCGRAARRRGARLADRDFVAGSGIAFEDRGIRI